MNEKPIRHVAIIMDGNGRWATQRNLPKIEGHRQGANQVSVVLEAAKEAKIEFLTLYAFSTENWKRSIEEVSALMKLMEEFLDKKIPELMEKQVRLRTIGRTDDLPLSVRKKLKKAIEDSAQNRAGTLNLALSYGGRAEIVDGVNCYIQNIKKSGKNPSKLTEESFRNYLYAPDIPDPDLLIRTSGEMRISNFLLWQLAYTEFYVTDKLWPDFGKEDFFEALAAFQRRERRFGGRK
ncbi:MAG: isoprenyl transferase [Victivallales bacterium]|jgi:undecaprenyl diphosphate synthase|nr:isoprenyl transferase [Victivallales bacterium]